MLIKAKDYKLFQSTFINQGWLFEKYYKEYRKFGTYPTTESLVPWSETIKTGITKEVIWANFHNSNYWSTAMIQKKKKRYNSLPSVYLVGHTDLDSCFCFQILNSGAYLPLSQENLINLLFMVVQITQYTPAVENRFNSLDRIIYSLLFSRLRKLAHPHYSKLRQGLPWCIRGKESAPPIQETQVRILIWEDPACWGTTKPVSLWACSRAWEQHLLKPPCPRVSAQQQEPPQWEAFEPQLREAPAHHN